MTTFHHTLDVELSILIASLVSAILIYLFLLFGRRFSLDERIFPAVTQRQRVLFGALGFFLLGLTALEILNPQSFATLPMENITFKPSWLGYEWRGISLQDWGSLAILAGFLVALIISVIRLVKRVSLITASRHASQADPSSFAADASQLRFAFNFCAVSFLIAIIAPSLDRLTIGAIPGLIIIGLFLISGIYCFIESMRLGAKYASTDAVKLGRLLLSQVLMKGLLLYLGIGLLGLFIYSVIPEHFDADRHVQHLPDLVRAITKVIAGVFVLLAAYLVAWGVSGASERLQKLMVVVSLAPLALPFWKILFVAAHESDRISYQSDSLFMASYSVVLGLLLLLAYVWSAHPARPRLSARHRRIGFVRSMGWTPFVADRIAHQHTYTYAYEYVGFPTREELLEDVIGRAAREGGTRRLPISLPWRHRISSRLGWHHDYDAIVIDLVGALRLLDALQRQGRTKSRRRPNRYFIVAGICHSDNVFLMTDPESSPGPPATIWSGSTYLPPNRDVHRCITEHAAKTSRGAATSDVTYLPPNCVGEFFPTPAHLVQLPEPFATDVIARLDRDGIPFRRLPAEELQSLPEWLVHRYDVLLVRDLNDAPFRHELIESIRRGAKWIQHLRGPAMFEDVFAPAIAAELDGAAQPGAGDCRLEASSITRSFFNVGFDNAIVIDPRGGDNWQTLCRFLEQMRQEGIVKELTRDDLSQACIPAAQLPIADDAAPYPLALQLVQVLDVPGRLRTVIQEMSEQDIDLGLVFAQRLGAGKGTGFIYLLPTEQSAAMLQAEPVPPHALMQDAVGFVPIAIDHRPGALDALLAVFEEQHININVCFAFPTSAETTIVLINLGSIPRSAMNRLHAALLAHGYPIAADVAAWHDGDSQAKRPQSAVPVHDRRS